MLRTGEGGGGGRGKVLIASAEVDAFGAIRPPAVPFAWRDSQFQGAATKLIETLCTLYQNTERDGRPFMEMLPIYEHSNPDYLPTDISLDQKLQWLFELRNVRPLVRPRFPDSIEGTLFTVFTGTEAGRGRGQLSHLRVAGPPRTSTSTSTGYCSQD